MHRATLLSSQLLIRHSSRQAWLGAAAISIDSWRSEEAGSHAEASPDTFAIVMSCSCCWCQTSWIHSLADGALDAGVPCLAVEAWALLLRLQVQWVGLLEHSELLEGLMADLAASTRQAMKGLSSRVHSVLNAAQVASTWSAAADNNASCRKKYFFFQITFFGGGDEHS